MLLELVSLLARLLVAAVADMVAPTGCAACDARLRRRAVFCGACASSVMPPPHRPAPFLGGRAVVYAAYGGAVATALKRLKYAGRPDVARLLGELLRHSARGARLSADIVVPVPLHPRRLAERGYNQSALLASRVAGELGARLETGAIGRLRNTPQQSRLPRAERLANVDGAFVVRRPERVRGRRVVLVDDVITTGATIIACTRPLLAAGATSVVALTVAQADLNAPKVLAARGSCSVAS